MKKLKDCTDQELLHSLSLGNRSAFIEIYERYWDRLLGVAFNRLNNIKDAEECVQDVIYNFWRNRREIELQNFRLEHYLARAIRNQAFNMLDKRYRLKHSAESVDADLLVTTISPEQEMIFKELERQFEAALQDLPAQCQFVFRLSR